MTQVLRGNIIQAPRLGELDIREHGYLVLEDGVVQGVYDALPQALASAPITDYGDRLIMQSFVDMHLHAPQYPMLGMGMDLPLLDWLNTYTFRTEARFADPDFARRTYRRLASDLITNGTTRVCMFSSLHTEATWILMEELERAGVTGYVGKVNMDRNGAPGVLEETTEESMRETLRWLDACQDLRHIKPILTPRFTPSCTDDLMDRLGKLPSSANSINFGRLAPQVVYYFTAYTDLVQRGAIRMGQGVNFVVPTGNFGDILAGYYAMRMGLPIRRLICASNRNNVLTDFFREGTYYTHRTFFKTMSPSMDILVSSNLERLLYECADRDGALVRTWMEQLSSCGSFSIGGQRLTGLQKVFWAGYADDKMTADEIRLVYERTHYVMDPHTSVGSCVLRQYRDQTRDQTPAVLVSTASPYKFAPDVAASLLGVQAVAGLDFLACAQKVEQLSGVPVPDQVRGLASLPVRHTAVCDPDGMEEALLAAYSA